MLCSVRHPVTAWRIPSTLHHTATQTISVISSSSAASSPRLSLTTSCSNATSRAPSTNTFLASRSSEFAWCLISHYHPSTQNVDVVCIFHCLHNCCWDIVTFCLCIYVDVVVCNIELISLVAGRVEVLWQSSCLLVLGLALVPAAVC